QLNALDTADLDDLHRILRDWTLGFAKIVLDEMQSRLRLVDELEKKLLDPATKEVQELQPLFKRGLWIFGPEYETIEYTSNVGMTKVVQDLFKSSVTGTLNRPDFAILPDSSVGLYSYPTFDKDGGETGVDRLCIIELKKPGVEISTDEKAQAWKYVKELFDHGVLQDSTQVMCFVLGGKIHKTESSDRTEMNSRVIIRPMHFDTLLKRARSRMLKLYERVKGAPFFNEGLEDFLAPLTVSAPSLELMEQPSHAKRSENRPQFQRANKKAPVVNP
ncbi:MAG: ATP-binding protein, partial [Gemmatimonadaceae bacterium]